ncbi:MAG TPA: hypothetical protein PKC49_06840, partial [Phycisphaerae bacterium]|nr:hypothetical protein [Phycisphaerae bacterium]
MPIATTSNGYSADVQIELRIGGKRFPVAQTGGGKLILDQPTMLPSSEGEVVMHIDGHEHRWRVALQPTTQPERVIAAEFSALPEHTGADTV